MPIVTSGTLRMSSINTELGRSSTSQIALDLAENGFYAPINQNSVFRPSASNPARITEWYGYNHTAAPATPTGVWTTSGNMPVGNCRASAAGTATAGRHVGGFGGPQCNFSYDGTSWSTNTGLPGATNNATAVGSQSCFMVMSGTDNLGSNINFARIWGGFTWTSTANMLVARILFQGAGTPLAGLAWGGGNAPNGTEAFNGTTWSSRNSLVNSRTFAPSNVGSQTAALAVNRSAAPTNSVEFYNGSTWSTVASSNVGRCMGMATGTSSGAVLYGGNPATNQSERYNGSSWSVTGSMNANRCLPTGGGSSTDAYAAGGSGLSSTERISF